jgi:hypothetical protein
MNYKMHHTSVDIINILLHFIIVYLAINFLLHFFIPNSALYVCILLPAPFLSYIIKRRTGHVWSFLLLHLLLIAAYAYTISNLYLKIAFLSYLVILTFVTYYKKNKLPYRKNTDPLYLLLLLTIYLGCYSTRYQTGMQLCFALGIVSILLYLINQYLLNLDSFVYEHSDIKNVPYPQIRNSNNVLVTFLYGLILFVMLIFSRLPLRNYLETLAKLFLRMMRFLVSLIHINPPEDLPDLILPPEEIPMDIPEQDPSYLIELIIKILTWLANIVAFAVILVFIIYIVYRIYKYFYLQNRETVDKIEFISPFGKKERVKRVSRQKQQSKKFGHTNNAMIRKLFYKAVSSNISGHAELAKRLTPSELSEYAIVKAENEETAAPEINKKRQLLTTYYEKARYSKEECSKEEVQLIKTILKQRK